MGEACRSTPWGGQAQETTPDTRGSTSSPSCGHTGLSRTHRLSHTDTNMLVTQASAQLHHNSEIVVCRGTQLGTQKVEAGGQGVEASLGYIVI